MRIILGLFLLIPLSAFAETKPSTPDYQDWCLEEINKTFRECMRNARTPVDENICRQDRDNNEKLCNTKDTLATAIR